MIQAPKGYKGKIYSTGLIYEHRYILEQKLDRSLNSNEVSHHINGNKLDNRPENLQVEEKFQHNSHHIRSRGILTIILKCPNCSIVFERQKRQTHLQKGGSFSACSDPCRGKFSRKIQMQGKTESIQKLIDGNVVKEYRKFNNASVSQLEREAAYEAEG